LWIHRVIQKIKRWTFIGGHEVWSIWVAHNASAIMAASSHRTSIELTSYKVTCHEDQLQLFWVLVLTDPQRVVLFVKVLPEIRQRNSPSVVVGVHALPVFHVECSIHTDEWAYRLYLKKHPCYNKLISIHKTHTHTIILRPLYRSTCVSRQLQLRTRGFSCAVLIPTCPCTMRIQIREKTLYPLTHTHTHAPV